MPRYFFQNASTAPASMTAISDSHCCQESYQKIVDILFRFPVNNTAVQSSICREHELSMKTREPVFLQWQADLDEIVPSLPSL